MAEEKPELKTILFLLNDTDPILLKVIENKFRKDAGWKSIIAMEYSDAISAFEREKPDAVLTEIIINDEKGRTGFDFIAEIKERKIDKKAKIIIFTELRQDEDKEKAKKLGVEHYFVKSEISLKELIEKIKSILH